jgi:hypothetical protein
MSGVDVMYGCVNRRTGVIEARIWALPDAYTWCEEAQKLLDKHRGEQSVSTPSSNPD